MRPDIEDAILEMYRMIDQAAMAQRSSGDADRGRRSGITSGKHLDQLTQIIRNDLISGGFKPDEIYSSGIDCKLPGWFRPTKNWDLIALDDSDLVCAVELKSIGSSFGNNANNRVEESIGSAVDFAEAYNERLYGPCSIPPVVGYVMVVRDCDASRLAARYMRSMHFDIDPVFDEASYLDRFHILCDRLRRKSLYNAVWLVFADPDNGQVYEPDQSMTYEVFLETLFCGLRLHRAQGR